MGLLLPAVSWSDIGGGCSWSQTRTGLRNLNGDAGVCSTLKAE